jgi:hypothetical protein
MRGSTAATLAASVQRLPHRTVRGSCAEVAAPHNTRRHSVLCNAGRFSLHTEGKSGVYAYEQETIKMLSDDELKQFRRRKKAWEWFEKVAPSYRKVTLHWVTSAKQPATRERRLAQLVESAAAGERRLR